MKRIVLIVLLVCTVSSCNSLKSGGNSSSYNEDNSTSKDKEQCISYGFAENTIEYKNCLKKLVEQRNQQMAL
jgi:hypothetical protein